jgi:nitrogen fixation/metabolism regulation signal transduction histidine kinase
LSQYKNIDNLSNAVLLFKNNKYLLIINPDAKIIFHKNILDKLSNKNGFLSYL